MRFTEILQSNLNLIFYRNNIMKILSNTRLKSFAAHTAAAAMIAAPIVAQADTCSTVCSVVAAGAGNMAAADIMATAAVACAGLGPIASAACVYAINGVAGSVGAAVAIQALNACQAVAC
ncbi:hypothetical protein [Massilia sp. Root335]|uniref:hypothetical protein n=1 Tax=Massilia sp. Root335 TaxID=1736517 RepID=UPI0012F62954|nr:hypothetical protein [Massilia sp. Root335]